MRTSVNCIYYDDINHCTAKPKTLGIFKTSCVEYCGYTPCKIKVQRIMPPPPSSPVRQQMSKRPDQVFKVSFFGKSVETKESIRRFENYIFIMRGYNHCKGDAFIANGHGKDIFDY